jgi:hypothetical protein
MKRRLTLLATLALMAAFLLGVVPASQAGSQDTYIKLTGMGGWSCTPGSDPWVNLTWATDVGDVSTHYWSLTNKRTGAQTTGVVGSIPPAPPANGGYSLPVPDGTQAGDTLEYRVEAASQLYDGSLSTLGFNCSTGAVLWNTFDFLPLTYQAVPIPSGFVLRTITCDTAVYADPAGSLVSGAAITAGQTWFINPTTVTGGDGQPWTEIFLAGVHTAYIPTACIGVAPSGY